MAIKINDMAANRSLTQKAIAQLIFFQGIPQNDFSEIPCATQFFGVKIEIFFVENLHTSLPLRVLPFEKGRMFSRICFRGAAKNIALPFQISSGDLSALSFRLET